MFPFGHGLSYTRFRYANLQLTGGATVTARFDVTNTGDRAGRDVPQVYVSDRGGRQGLRLIGWSNVALAPGETRRVEVEVDPKLVADWSTTARAWIVPAGRYAIQVGPSSASAALRGAAQLSARSVR